MNSKLFLVGFSLWIFTLCAHAQIKVDFPVEKFKLKNGLTVLLHADNSVPMVSYHTWYKVGSRDETLGVTGAAHMLEHMMFKGAKKYTNKDFDRILSQNGIVNNAFTTADYTGFYENLPSDKLDLIMDVELDRMKNLAIAPEELKSELQVVGEERRYRVDNNPNGLLNETLTDLMFTAHPYKFPTIGYMTDIQAYSSEKLRKFYSTYYVPNNAVLIIAGDINIEKTKKMVMKYYDELPFKDVPERKYAVEPDVTKPRKKSIKGPVQNTNFMMAFKSIEAGHADGYALDVLSQVLAGGTSSRLHKKMVYEARKATGVYAHNESQIDPGVFEIYASLQPKVSADQVLPMIRNAIRQLQTTKIKEKELKKVKTQFMKEFVDGLQTIDGKANSLAINEVLYGDYKRLFTDLERYNQVTPEDIQRVAKKYLDPKKEVTVVLNPAGKE